MFLGSRREERKREDGELRNESEVKGILAEGGGGAREAL